MGIDRWAASRAGSRVWAQRPMARNNSPRRYSHSGNRRPGSESTTVRRRRAWCWRLRSELRGSLVLRRHLRPLASLISSRPAFRVALPYISPAAGHRERIAMRHLALAALLLLGSPALGQTLWLASGPPTLAQVLPQPKPGVPGASCPFGYTSSGAFCIPSQRAQQAIPLAPNGSCPWGWTRSGSY